MPLRGKKMVDYIDKNLSHIAIPEQIRDRMTNAGIEEGIHIAQELTKEILPIKEVAGIHLFPMNKLSLIPQLIMERDSDDESVFYSNR
ncbi:MAG: 5,10-methylenetetrahydrofolate reductase, partial [Caldisericia bacterium]|nr:5,10-methylenetetrahydrofolate reductase [Caldisericia bacterium]MDD5689395.1 5,10-methylenetetrahydrofolate reductase [Caldisericia bacterium]